MTDEQAKDRIDELEAQLEFWKRAYRKAISHDHAIIQHLKEAQYGTHAAE